MWHIRTTLGNTTQVVRHKTKAEVLAALEKVLPDHISDNFTVVLAYRVGPPSKASADKKE